MSPRPGFLRRLRLRHAVFLALLLAGIVPLAISSYLLIFQNRDLIRTQREAEILSSAVALARDMDVFLGRIRERLAQFGEQLVVLTPPGSLESQMRTARFREYLRRFQSQQTDLEGMQIVNPVQDRALSGLPDLSELGHQTIEEARERAMDEERTVFRFLAGTDLETPKVVIAVPILDNRGKLRLVIAGLAELHLLDDLRDEAQEEDEVFLIDADHGVPWTAGVTPEDLADFERSGAPKKWANDQVHYLTPETAPDGTEMSVVSSRIEEAGWTVVVRRPASVAFEAVDEMVFKTLLSSLIVVLLALLLSFLAARQVSQPIQKLAQTSHEMADGNFGHRIETTGLLFEMADLGEDFNRMSAHVERYIGELKRAAQLNRDLFIGSLRAFVAAIDAKDPYTRGHSERVARVSRIVARYLGQTPEQQERIWIAALLHDVGKIGVEDRVLQKVGRLTEEEFRLMKLHPVIGAEIISPIEQLKHAQPVVRWHHENWNGRGYPDGLKGEEIPLDARIVAVADTFDAVTTNRPYQQAFTLEFAVETITKLTGKRFDAKITTAFLNAYENGEITVATPTLEERHERSPIEVEKRVLSMT